MAVKRSKQPKQKSPPVKRNIEYFNYEKNRRSGRIYTQEPGSRDRYYKDERGKRRRV